VLVWNSYEIKAISEDNEESVLKMEDEILNVRLQHTGNIEIEMGTYFVYWNLL
jgi:hypothetical protein